MTHATGIDKVLRPLALAPYQAYISNTIQVADVLEWILKQFGESEVWQTTFSISEEFIRRLYFIEKSGSVSRLTLFLDLKAVNKTIRLWPFLSKVVDNAFLGENHSKLLLVRSSTGAVASVVTSQNLTRGNRNECTMITTDKGVFASLHSQLNEILKYHSVPLNDLYRDRLQQD